MLDKSDLARLVQDFYATVLERENQLRLLGSVALDEESRRERIAHYEQVAREARDDLAKNRLESADFIAAAMIKKHGFAGQLTNYEVRQVQQAMLRAGVDAAEAVKARFEGDFTFRPNDQLLQIELEKIGGENRNPPRDGSQAQSPPPVADSTEHRPFTEVADEFRVGRTIRKEWENQTALQARKTYQLFAELCGDRPLSGYLRSDAIRFRDMLISLPANYGKAPEFRGMTGLQIAETTAARPLARLAPRTVQRHLAALSALWEAAGERAEVAANIFAGLKLPRSKRPQDQRSMWTSDQLAKLFATPVWRGCFSKDRRSKPGDLVIRDEKFWLPLIALYSGLRQEEICQLHSDDVREEGGVWVLDVNARPPRQLKNQNAVRLVPVHSTLERLGFLKYVAEQMAAGHELVFHQLKRGGADERFGHNYTKWFTRYRKDVGLYEPGLDFHSFRHSATTLMQWAGVAVPIIDALTGHATSGETARYTKSFQISQLRQGIEAISPDIDLSHLEPAKLASDLA